MNAHSPQPHTVLSPAFKGQLLLEHLNDHAMEEHQILPLLNQTLDLTLTDQLGRSALHLAISRDFSNIVQHLLMHGAPIHSATKGGLTALHKACQFNRPQIITLLLHKGAAVSAQDLNGNTPLHAYANNHRGTYSDPTGTQLCNAPDFNPTLRNRDGETALDLICREHSSAFAWQLADCGSPISYHTVHHSDLGERYLKAQRRWEDFQSNPDVTALTHTDIALFSNYQVLPQAFSPELWRNHQTDLRHLFAALPLFMQDTILTHQPALLHLLGQHPTSAVEGWSIERAATPAPTPARL